MQSTFTAQPIHDTALDTEHLIIFARFPEEGRTKTRLIPAFGAKTATAIYRRLATHALQTAEQLRLERPCRVTTRYSGGDQRAMIEEFGLQCQVEPQLGGDLGERLVHAIEAAFGQGAKRVVIIGTDCVDVTPEILATAFDKLQHDDLVLGPAMDGGYYLIGVNRPQPMLFSEISWGTDLVYAQTRELASRMDLRVFELPSLSDVDFPEDLVAIKHQEMLRDVISLSPGRLSVIIPTWNEAERLRRTLESVGRCSEELEIVVVDGGSADGTVEIAKECGCRVFAGNRGRARQMNAGAAVATGEYLLFLHADTLLPAGYEDQIRDRLQQAAIATAFPFRIEGARMAWRAIEFGTNLRASLFQLPYGDQAMAMRADTFYRLGGYRRLPIMEDVDLSARLRREGTISILSSPIVTSERRWKRMGAVRTTLINQACLLGYFCGISPATIARLYGR